MKPSSRHEITVVYVLDETAGPASEEALQELGRRMDDVIGGLAADYFICKEARYEKNRLVMSLDYKRPRGT